MSDKRQRRKRPEWRSKVIEEWRMEGRRELVVRILRVRFPGCVPKEVTAMIEREPERAVLDTWFDVIATASTVAEVCDALFR